MWKIQILKTKQNNCFGEGTYKIRQICTEKMKKWTIFLFWGMDCREKNSSTLKGRFFMLSLEVELQENENKIKVQM